jgi:hypothetical protein
VRYVGEEREFSQPRDDLAWPRSELARHAQVDQVCTRSAHMAAWNRKPCRMGYDVPACSGVAKSGANGA